MNKTEFERRVRYLLGPLNEGYALVVSDREDKVEHESGFEKRPSKYVAAVLKWDESLREMVIEKPEETIPASWVPVNSKSVSVSCAHVHLEFLHFYISGKAKAYPHQTSAIGRSLSYSAENWDSLWVLFSQVLYHEFGNGCFFEKNYKWHDAEEAEIKRKAMDEFKNTQEKIQKLAYDIYASGSEGTSHDHWLRAENEILKGTKSVYGNSVEFAANHAARTKLANKA